MTYKVLYDLSSFWRFISCHSFSSNHIQLRSVLFFQELLLLQCYSFCLESTLFPSPIPILSHTSSSNPSQLSPGNLPCPGENGPSTSSSSLDACPGPGQFISQPGFLPDWLLSFFVWLNSSAPRGAFFTLDFETQSPCSQTFLKFFPSNDIRRKTLFYRYFTWFFTFMLMKEISL